MEDELRVSVQPTEHGGECPHSPGSNGPCAWCDADWEADGSSSPAGLACPGLSGCPPLSTVSGMLPCERPASPYALDPPDLACQPSGSHVVGNSLAPGAPYEYRRQVRWASSMSCGAASPQQRDSLRYARPGTPWQPRLYTVHAVAASDQAARRQAKVASPRAGRETGAHSYETRDAWRPSHCGGRDQWEKQALALERQQHEERPGAVSPGFSPQSGRTNTPSPTAFFCLGDSRSPRRSGSLAQGVCAASKASPATWQVAAPGPCPPAAWTGDCELQQDEKANCDPFRPSSPPWPEGLAYPGLSVWPRGPSSLPSQLMNAQPEESCHLYPGDCHQLRDLREDLGTDSYAGSCFGESETSNAAPSDDPLTLHGADWSSVGVLIRNLRRSAFGSDLPLPVGPAACDYLQACKSEPSPWELQQVEACGSRDEVDCSSPGGNEQQAGVLRKTPGEQSTDSPSPHGTRRPVVSPSGRSNGWRLAWISPRRSPGSKRAPPALRIPGSRDMAQDSCGYSPLGDAARALDNLHLS